MVTLALLSWGKDALGKHHDFPVPTSIDFPPFGHATTSQPPERRRLVRRGRDDHLVGPGRGDGLHEPAARAAHGAANTCSAIQQPSAIVAEPSRPCTPTRSAPSRRTDSRSGSEIASDSATIPRIDPAPKSAR